MLYHSHKKRKVSLETRAVLLVDIFGWTWNIWGSRTEDTLKQWKMVSFGRNCLVKMTLRLFSHFLLLWLGCQGSWGSSEDRYRSKRVSQMLLMCYNLLNSQNIPINQQHWKLVGYRDTSNIAKKAAEVARKKEHGEFYP